jgi:hypothetical protein
MNIERERAAEEVTKEGGYKRFGCGDFFGALGALEYCLERGGVLDGVWVRGARRCVGHGGITLIKTSDGVVRFVLGEAEQEHGSPQRCADYCSTCTWQHWDWGLGQGAVHLGLGHCGIRLFEGNCRGERRSVRDCDGECAECVECGARKEATMETRARTRPDGKPSGLLQSREANSGASSTS